MTDTTDGDHDSERDDRRRFIRRVGIVIGLVILSGLLVALFLESITVFFLLFAAILWTVLLRGLAELLAEYTPIPVRLALAIVLLTLIGLAVGLGFVSGPNIAHQYERITQKFPEAIDQAHQWLRTSPFGEFVPKSGKLEETVTAGGEVWSRVSGILSGALGVIGNSLVVLVVGIYLSIDPDRYKRGLVALFPIGYRDRAREMLDETSYQLSWWLGGRAITMVAVGVLTTLGLSLLGVPLALFIGVLTGILTFVPIIGPFVSAVPAMLMGLLKGPMFVVYVGALYLGIQAIENYLLTPIVGEKAVHIPPALLIMAQVLIGLLTGILGVILATPLLVTVIVIVKRGFIEDVLGDTDA